MGPIHFWTFRDSVYSVMKSNRYLLCLQKGPQDGDFQKSKSSIIVTGNGTELPYVYQYIELVHVNFTAHEKRLQ